MMAEPVVCQTWSVKARTAAGLASFIGGLAFVSFLASAALVATRPTRLPDGIEPFDLAPFLLENGPFTVFTGIGVLIVVRRAQNPIGWMFTAVGFLFLFGTFAAEYALYALYTSHGSMPGGTVMAWVSTWVWLSAVGLVSLVILLFPNGRVTSPRWRPLVWLVVADTTAMVIGVAVLLWPDRGLQLVAGLDNATLSPAAERLALIGFPILIVALVLSAASMVLRFRRARGEERQQLKWVAYGCTLLGASVVLSEASNLAGITLPELSSQILENAGAMAVPVATGVAILKYRLYDIDLIINRTLVYGSLTAFLAVVYYALVVALQQVVAGDGRSSPLVVAGSTLAVSALFRPARDRIQKLIDRRFNRRKYDAARTIEVFSARLRDEVDLDLLSDHLLAVVRETMEPAGVSLWLKPSSLLPVRLE
jgi:hypothetical protein